MADDAAAAVATLDVKDAPAPAAAGGEAAAAAAAPKPKKEKKEKAPKAPKEKQQGGFCWTVGLVCQGGAGPALWGVECCLGGCRSMHTRTQRLPRGHTHTPKCRSSVNTGCWGGGLG